MPRRTLEVCDSTNDEAFAWITEGASHGATVRAVRQRAGRGRLGRAWDSGVSGDVYASVVLLPGLLEHSPGALALAAGAGLRAGLALVSPPGPTFALKWPNDVWLDGKKVAGILCESRWSGQVPSIVVGFGINVGRMAFAPELAAGATSLALAFTDRAPSVNEVLDAVLLELSRTMSAFFADGFVGIRDEYTKHCALLGQRVRLPASKAGEARFARALRLDMDGALIVRGADGEIRLDQADVWLAPGETDP